MNGVFVDARIAVKAVVQERRTMFNVVEFACDSVVAGRKVGLFANGLFLVALLSVAACGLEGGVFSSNGAHCWGWGGGCLL